MTDKELIRIYNRMMVSITKETRDKLLDNISDIGDREKMRDYFKSRFGGYSIHHIDKNGMYKEF